MFPAGWYTGAPTPGELGPAIITGHVDWGGHPGVFFNLRNLNPAPRSPSPGPTPPLRYSG